MLSVFHRADVFAGDHPAHAHDREPGRGAVRQRGPATRAEAPAHEEGHRLTQRPVRISGDRHHLSMEIGW